MLPNRWYFNLKISKIPNDNTKKSKRNVQQMLIYRIYLYGKPAQK